MLFHLPLLPPKPIPSKLAEPLKVRTSFRSTRCSIRGSSLHSEMAPFDNGDKPCRFEDLQRRGRMTSLPISSLLRQGENLAPSSTVANSPHKPSSRAAYYPSQKWLE